ncbi:hypothetical protein [Pseudomonas aeruginosa]|uniref:hypothetical protein n=1 Tax=Pseudomonas aeruginosa TaxID=287 RepID=UPI001F3A3AE0|nr:hypothetical protein [Pseudomonas aeruginosa]
MNVFLIAQDAARGQLPRTVTYLAQVPLDSSLLTAVVVIDERSWEVPEGDVCPGLKTFLLDDFLHEKGSVANGEFTADANVIAEKLSQASESWLVVDMGLHGRNVVQDFIRKLATFTYLFPALRGKNIVLLMPQLFLGFMGRYVNDALNNTPASVGVEDGAHRYELFLFSILMEKLYMSSPFIAWPVTRLWSSFRFVYKRIVGVRY